MRKPTPALKSSRHHRIVLVTAPSLSVARALAAAALRLRLAACANLVPRIESHYWWQGKLEKSTEVLLVFKTRTPLLRPLQDLIITQHPYDTPEFVALPVSAAAAKYLAWWDKETCAGPPGNSQGRAGE